MKLIELIEIESWKNEAKFQCVGCCHNNLRVEE